MFIFQSKCQSEKIRSISFRTGLRIVKAFFHDFLSSAFFRSRNIFALHQALVTLTNGHESELLRTKHIYDSLMTPPEVKPCDFYDKLCVFWENQSWLTVGIATDDEQPPSLLRKIIACNDSGLPVFFEVAIPKGVAGWKWYSITQLRASNTGNIWSSFTWPVSLSQRYSVKEWRRERKDCHSYYVLVRWKREQFAWMEIVTGIGHNMDWPVWQNEAKCFLTLDFFVDSLVHSVLRNEGVERETEVKWSADLLFHRWFYLVYWSHLSSEPSRFKERKLYNITRVIP